MKVGKMKVFDKKVLEYIHFTMNTVGMDLRVKRQRAGINMSYNFITNDIGYDHYRIKEALNKMKTPVSLESYVKTFTLHEIGHALDRDALMDSLDRTVEIFRIKKEHSLSQFYHDAELLQLLIEEHEMNIQFEETAWENAHELNKEYRLVHSDLFNELKEQGMQTYMDVYEESLEAYSKLEAGHGVLIA